MSNKINAISIFLLCVGAITLGFALALLMLATGNLGVIR